MQQVATQSPNIAAPRVKGNEPAKDSSASQQSQAFSEHFQRQQQASEQRRQSTSNRSAEQQAVESASARESRAEEQRNSSKTRKQSSETETANDKAAAQQVQDSPSKQVGGKSEPSDARNSERTGADKPEQKKNVVADDGKSGEAPTVKQDNTSAEDANKADQQQQQYWLNLIQDLAEQHSQQTSEDDTDADIESSVVSLKGDTVESGAVSLEQLLKQLGLDADKVTQQLDESERQALEADLKQLSDKEGQEQADALTRLLDKIAALLQQGEQKGSESSLKQGELKAPELFPKQSDQPLDPAFLEREVRQFVKQIQQLQEASAGNTDSETGKLTPQEILALRQQLLSASDEQVKAVTDKKLAVEDLEALRQQLLTQEKHIQPTQNQKGKDILEQAQSNTVDPLLKGQVSAEQADKALKAMAAMSDKQLDQTLSQLSQAVSLSEQGDKTTFISSLKAGVEEFKAQLKQGREPGIDLKAMVAQAMSETTESGDETAKLTQETVNRLSSQLTESVHRPQTANSSQSQGQMDMLGPHVAAERASGVQVESMSNAKSPLSQSSPAGQMERAINLAKSEAAQQLADRVRMMVDQGNMSAEVRLDPPELGSMQIRVQMSGEQASVNMTVQNQQAKEMLDQTMPRLREMLSDKGLELGQSSVEQEQQQAGQDGEGEGRDSANHGGSGDLDEAGDTEVVEMDIVNGSPGGIDYFV